MPHSGQHAHGRYVRAFLAGVFGDGPIDLRGLASADGILYIVSLAGRCRPSTVSNARAALRAFFCFLRVQSVRDDHLEDALPPAASKRRLVGLPRHIEAAQLERLLSSLDASTPTAKRDRAMILCVARLGLRSSEVIRICLDDIDWRAAVLHVRSRKTGHGASLPLPPDVGAAIVDYLQHGRPRTGSRHVFVLHHLRVGDPASPHTLYDAVSTALETAGIQAPTRGPNLLRHTLATRLVRSGASLSEIADLLGHRCLSTTQIYAKLDLPSLREVAQPWPGVQP
jgi:site-specific recombinase XerD